MNVSADHSTQASAQDVKAKRSRKNKKKDSTSETLVSTCESVPALVDNEKKKTKIVSKDDTKEEDVSVKTDSGIVDEPSAAKKKSKSKKQREKKAAAAAAAKEENSPEPKETSQVKEKIVIDLTPTAAAASTKPKDKKKKSKNSSVEQKTKEDNDKVQFDK